MPLRVGHPFRGPGVCDLGPVVVADAGVRVVHLRREVFDDLGDRAESELDVTSTPVAHHGKPKHGALVRSTSVVSVSATLIQ